ESSCLTRYDTEEIILQRLVLCVRRHTASGVTRVHVSRQRRIRIGEVEWAQIRCLELDGYRTGRPLPLECWHDDAANVFSELPRRVREAEIVEVSSQQRALLGV